MLLTCPQCLTQYRVEQSQLGLGGRMVRCSSCRNVWFQEPPKEKDELIISAAPPMEIDFGDRTETSSSSAGESFADILGAQPDIPQAVKPLPQPAPSAPAVTTYRPMGMGDAQFGIFAFLALLFTTLIPLFLARGLIVRVWPPMSGFYGTVGLGVHAPGDGLRFSGVEAERRITGGKKELVVRARLSNMAESGRTWPALEAVLLGVHGEELKAWDFEAQDIALAPGEEKPVVLDLVDAPEEGQKVQLRVVD